MRFAAQVFVCFGRAILRKTGNFRLSCKGKSRSCKGKSISCDGWDGLQVDFGENMTHDDFITVANTSTKQEIQSDGEMMAHF